MERTKVYAEKYCLVFICAASVGLRAIHDIDPDLLSMKLEAVNLGRVGRIAGRVSDVCKFYRTRTSAKWMEQDVDNSYPNDVGAGCQCEYVVRRMLSCDADPKADVNAVELNVFVWRIVPSSLSVHAEVIKRAFLRVASTFYRATMTIIPSTST